MATESPANEFGRVSRVKGKLFEMLTFGASVTGILALAALLIYVSVDAFNLEAASPEWLLVYFCTLVIPYIGFCLYETQRTVKRLTGVVLAGGLVVTAAAFTAVEALIRPIPRLNWQLTYLFAVVLPITGYVSIAGSSTKTGAVGFGLLGRLAGGGALGLWIFVLFAVFDIQMWLLIYTMGIVPGVVAAAVFRRWELIPRVLGLAHRLSEPARTVLAVPRGLIAGLAPSDVLTAPGRVSRWILTRPHLAGRYASEILTTPAILRKLLVGLTGIGGISLAYTVRGSVPVYPTELLVLIWSLVLPATVLVTLMTARRHNRRRGLLTGAVVFALAVGGGYGLSVVALSTRASVLLMLGVALPTIPYLYCVVPSGSGRAGLALPVLLIGGILIGAVIIDALGISGPSAWLDLSYLRGAPTTQTTQARSAGLFPPIVGSVLIITLVAILSFILGVGTAVFLEEYTKDTGYVGAVSRLIQVNIANLAAVPSVVYGLLGLAVFVNLFGFGFGTAVSASLTLSLLILPITVISAQEAIRSVPDELRDASLAMGGTRWQTTKNVVLPEAMPGILTGIILALGRAIGETAPLIMIGMANIAFSAPTDIFSRLSAMPMMIYQWASNPSAEFRFGVVAAGVLTLLAVLLTMNATAIIIRNKYERGV